MRPLLIIDVSSYIFRAYHAVPPFVAADGRQVNAIYGFIASFLKLTHRFKECDIVAALDSGRNTFRKKEYPKYKANRKEIDPELREQFPLIEPMLTALDVPSIRKPGFEADDIIASLCKEHSDRKIVIVSTDKDLMQLANDKVTLYDTFKNRILGPAEVKEKLGVEPQQVKELLALMGDASDNIPGLPGIGIKTAAKLLNAYDNIEGIYQNIDQLKPKQKETFKTQRELLDMSLFLVSLAYPEVDIAPQQWNGVNQSLFYQFAHPLGFRKFIADLVSDDVALAEHTEQEGETGIKKSEPFIAGTLSFEKAAPLFAIIRQDGTWIVGSEGIYQEMTTQMIPKGSEIWSFDVKSLLNAPFPPHIFLRDLQIASFTQNSGEHNYTLKQATFLAGWESTPSEGEQGAVLALYHDIHRSLTLTDQQMHLLTDVEMPHVEAIRAMEQEGILIDTPRLNILLTSYKKQIEQLEKEIYRTVGEEFNINSPKQLAHILFEKMGLPIIKKRKTGPSTDHQTLETLAEMSDDPLPELIVSYREYTKLLNTYLEPIKEKTGEDDRLHTTFHLTHAATGRLSSRDPNLQNIPVRTDVGKEIRSLFMAKDGYTLLSFDYSQIELRVLAALSGDRELLNAFENGEDIHRKTASAIFGTFPEFVDDTMRSHAKAVNFGIIYGMQAFKLSKDTGVSVAFAKQYIENYFSFYKEVKTFIDETVKKAEESGFVETMLGRRRYVPELKLTNKNKKKQGERIAVNTIIQGSAADIIKTGTVAIYKSLLAQNLKARILLQVHDELIIEAPLDEVERVSQLVISLLSQAAPSLKTALTVHHSIGTRWDALK
ncbi:hypothetical protein KAH37_00675 [bacterium]|nr:hypothetical protein [bacterium]